MLVVNSGSSSIKYQLVDPVGGEAIASGIVERIGEDEGSVRHTYGGSTTERTDPVADHGAGLRAVLALFDEVGPDLAAGARGRGRPPGGARRRGLRLAR